MFNLKHSLESYVLASSIIKVADMNFQFAPVLPPLKVLVVNPLLSASQLIIVKIMSGAVFGSDQLIDLILLVYSNEKSSAEEFILELRNCAFPCMNSLEVSSDLPSLSDADVFCFITTFKNPNSLDFENIDNDIFDELYLMIKIANSLRNPIAIPEPDDDTVLKKNKRKVEPIPRKPIIFTDGLVALDVLKTLSQNVPNDIFFCPTPLATMAKYVLADYLKVECSVINETLVWAANDEVFHVEVEKPLIIHDRAGDGTKCDWDMLGKDLVQSINLDHTQFNESWMKKEFIEKILSYSLKNPYGCIYRASEFTKNLQTIWRARSKGDAMKVYCSLGVISDGTLGTIKGYPCVLPLVFVDQNWTVNTRFEETPHLRQEIKRINKAIKEHHQKLIPYCKKFLEDNIINQAFVPDDESGSIYSIIEHSSHNR